MDKFMLIFRNTPSSEEEFNSMSPEAMQAELEKWNTWIGGIAAQGKFVVSDALEQSGKVVRGTKHVVSDGPYVEGKELVSGYLTLEASGIDEAIELSKGCPIYDMNGSLEVRKLMVFN
jgi:hypothetical protein